ncbi:MAG: glycerol-3-phosphate 1-O-acyltransferase PlsY [Clostridiales Family XIII bacterium]|jgi:glycerol-3-phosphate acyltransferase PlsY|nr:glycerol-3-phosphate 1-O-acyltransferase PlsY [Clostridiales Family XIII bacterium]
MTSLLSAHLESFAHAGLPPALLVCIAVGCYFIGNINPAILIGKAYGVDVRSEGSGNAGMTNVMRTVGRKAGIFTFAIDVLKGLLPTLALIHTVGAPFGMMCGVIVAIGHIWPAVYGLKGGKGVSTCFGVVLAFNAVLALILIAVVLLCAVITKRVSAGTLVACACAAPIAYFMAPMDAPAMLAIAVLVVISHRANIARLVKGAEPRMSFGKKDEQ